jgi:hypothetical protein
MGTIALAITHGLAKSGETKEALCYDKIKPVEMSELCRLVVP